MKKLVFATFVISASLVNSASGQVKSVAAANKPTSSPNGNQTSTNATRARMLSPDPKSVPTGSIVSSGTIPVQARPDLNHAAVARFRRVNPASVAPVEPTAKAASTASNEKGVARGNLKSATALAANTTTTVPSGMTSSSTQVYRVGVCDVLDIKLTDHPGKNSTLFTVLEGGLLEYPLAGNPIAVAGSTASEIEALLKERIKIFDNPTVTVSVRDYASHAVTVSGFVTAPGTKVLRREAVPLYTVLAEALILPDAARATITRPGRNPVVVDLKDANLSATLVAPGDDIKVAGPPTAPTEFYFVGGEIGSPGQKPYHAGLTLTQAILASGGTSASATAKVRVSRQGTDGRLITDEYNLRKIQTGKTPDPILQNGDRIEVTNAN